MRRAKSKKRSRKMFGINKPGAAEFERMIEECSIEKEVFAAFNEFNEGRDFYKMDPETRRELICETLK